MFNIVSIIIVAILGVIGNIAYFEYRLKKEHRKEIIKEQLTKLLLPLYIAFENDEIECISWQKSEGVNFAEYKSEEPDRLRKPIKDVLTKNLYLADDELQMYSLLFLRWAFDEDSSERFQKLMAEGLGKDKPLDDLRECVYKKYNEQRNKYLK